MPFNKSSSVVLGNFNSSGSVQNIIDGALINFCETPITTPQRSVFADDALGNQDIEFRHLSPSCSTPNLYTNGIEGWPLTSSSLTFAMPSPTQGLLRASSLVSSTSQKYTHDPYSLSGSQRLSPKSVLASNSASPNECPLPTISTPPFNDNTTNPLTVAIVAALPKERNENRGKRKGRTGEHSRSSKPLPDAPPPTTMRYLPPPPPALDNLELMILSQEAIQRIAHRWYERTIAAEQSYSWRIHAPVWIPAFAVPMARQQPLIAAKQMLLCPRMECFSNHSFWSWLSDVGRWWEGAIRPLTGAAMPPPPPYGY